METDARRPPARFQVGHLLFRADFDSGNLANAKLVESTGGVSTVELNVAADCVGTPYENKYKQWYCFAVSGAWPGETIFMRILDLNPIAKVYNSDLRPLVRVPTRSPTWERLEQPSTYAVNEGSVQIDFAYTVLHANEEVYFAYYYPFSYADNQRLLDLYETAFGFNEKPAERRPFPSLPHSVYFVRELLTLTPQSRRVELLTISSTHGMTTDREGGIPDVFPEQAPRPFRFKGKSAVYIGARVHPAETGASYMLWGFIQFLLSTDPRAGVLRQQFVFKIVPMLNPDGVVAGHFRSDCMGANLNRAYSAPDPIRHPAIYAVKQLLTQLASTMPINPIIPSESGLSVCLDLHSYSARTGCYILGNNVAARQETQCVTFAQKSHHHHHRHHRSHRLFDHLPAHQPPGARTILSDLVRLTAFAPPPQAVTSSLSLAVDAAGRPVNGSATNAPLADTDTAGLLRDWRSLKHKSAGRGEARKEGTGRVWVYKELGVVHSYTIECSCNLMPHDCSPVSPTVSQLMTTAAREEAQRPLPRRSGAAAGGSTSPSRLSSTSDWFLCDVHSLCPAEYATSTPWALIAGMTPPPRPRSCEWGSCHLLPPEAFACVGRGLGLTMLDITGAPVPPVIQIAPPRATATTAAAAAVIHVTSGTSTVTPTAIATTHSAPPSRVPSGARTKPPVDTGPASLSSTGTAAAVVSGSPIRHAASGPTPVVKHVVNIDTSELAAAGAGWHGSTVRTIRNLRNQGIFEQVETQRITPVAGMGMDASDDDDDDANDEDEFFHIPTASAGAASLPHVFRGSLTGLGAAGVPIDDDADRHGHGVSDWAAFSGSTAATSASPLQATAVRQQQLFLVGESTFHPMPASISTFTQWRAQRRRAGASASMDTAAVGNLVRPSSPLTLAPNGPPTARREPGKAYDTAQRLQATKSMPSITTSMQLPRVTSLVVQANTVPGYMTRPPGHTSIEPHFIDTPAEVW